MQSNVISKHLYLIFMCDLLLIFGLIAVPKENAWFVLNPILDLSYQNLFVSEVMRYHTGHKSVGLNCWLHGFFFFHFQIKIKSYNQLFMVEDASVNVKHPKK